MLHPVVFECMSKDTSAKKHVKTDRLACISSMKCPVVVQRYDTHNLQEFPGTHHEVFPSGHGHEVDMLTIADWSVIIKDLRRWSKDMTASVPAMVDHTWFPLQWDIHVIHMSYTCHTHVTHMPYTCHIHVIHMSSICHTHVIHMPYTCHILGTHMAYKVYGGFHHIGHYRHEGIEIQRMDYCKGSSSLARGHLRKGTWHRRPGHEKLHATLAGVAPTP